MDSSKKIDKEVVLGYVDRLPAFNATITKILRLSNDPKSSPRDIMQAISVDPTLTAKILKMINSAYFGVPSKVVSLNRAVVMLGLNTIKNIAIGSGVTTQIHISSKFKWFTGDEFWEHCLGCAVGSKMIAEKIHVPVQEREEYFIAGLLHDIGKVIFVQYLSDDFSRILDPSYHPEEDKTIIEARELGIDHAELGNVIAMKWKLPTILSETISQHHNPVFEGGGMDKIKAAVYISNISCNILEIGIKKSVTFGTGSIEEAHGILSLTQEELDKLFEELPQKVEDAKVFLKG
ncbi:MAG: HDOD domain-containing protein [Nitrospinota bacterium]